MSRCFPFPPPGYEKKTRVDETDLLAKEKQKERKHKKDKKHKEKKEDKDKKDKDRSKEKRREKKHRKEKHKEKEKDGISDKSQVSYENRVEGQAAAQNNGQKVCSSDNAQSSEIKDSKLLQELAKRISNDSGVSSASQAVQKKIATDQKRPEPPVMSVVSSAPNRSIEKERSRGNGEDQGKASGQRNHIEAKGMEKAYARNFPGTDKPTADQTAKSAEKKKGDEKPVEGKEKKHRDSKGDKDKDRGSKSKSKDKSKERKKEEKVKDVRQPGKDLILKESKNSLDFGNVISSDPSKLSSGIEGTILKRKEIKGEMFTESGPRLKESNLEPLDFRNIKTSSPSTLSKMTVISEGTIAKHKELEGPALKQSIPKLKGSNKDSLDFRITKTSNTSKLNNMNFGNEGILGKRKELEDVGQMMKESKRLSPDFRSIKTLDPSKLSNTTLSREGTPVKHKVLGEDSLDLRNIKPSDESKLSSTTSSNEGTPGKRKELDDSGNKTKESKKNTLDFRANKIMEPLKLNSEGTLGKRKELELNGHLLDNGHRPSKLPRPLPTDPVIQNGKKSEPFQTAIQLASEKQEAAANGKGVEIKEHKINGFITAEPLNPIPERPLPAKVPAIPKKETVKPPHPDTKYLGQILSVPERVELPGFCDQDWLFSGVQPSKKPCRDSPVTDGTKEVWAEALRIESADISALPYVIPY